MVCDCEVMRVEEGVWLWEGEVGGVRGWKVDMRGVLRDGGESGISEVGFRWVSEWGVGVRFNSLGVKSGVVFEVEWGEEWGGRLSEKGMGGSGGVFRGVMG